MSGSSEGVLDEVAEWRRQRQSSSEEGARRSDKTLQQGFAMGIRERRPDAAPDVLGAACTSSGRSRRTPPTTKAPPDMLISQHRHVCVEKYPLTMGHAATRSHTQRGQLRERARSGQLRERVTRGLSDTALAGVDPGGQSERKADRKWMAELWSQRPPRAARGGGKSGAGDYVGEFQLKVSVDQDLSVIVAETINDDDVKQRLVPIVYTRA